MASSNDFFESFDKPKPPPPAARRRPPPPRPKTAAPPPPSRPKATTTNASSSTATTAASSTTSSSSSSYYNTPAVAASTTTTTARRLAAGPYSIPKTAAAPAYSTPTYKAPAPAAAYQAPSTYQAPAPSTFQAAPAPSTFQAPAPSTYQAPAPSTFVPQAPAPSTFQAPAPSTFQAPAPSTFTPQATATTGSNADDWYNGSSSTTSNTFQPNSFLQGSMNTNSSTTNTNPYAAAPTNPAVFVPQQQQQQQVQQPIYHDTLDDLVNEPPLLEELGIHLSDIVLKTKAVVLPFMKQTQTVQNTNDDDDDDLVGPLALALLLGFELLLLRKLTFGTIYGFGLAGCAGVTVLCNLMATQAVSFWKVTSILGYSLLPLNALAALTLVLPLTRPVASIVAVVWSTTASTRLLEVQCQMRSQRYLLAYPIALLYTAFCMITVF